MDATSENKPKNNPKKHICVGLLAHVDAGKTTLSEGMLYTSGTIRKMGRVDNRDAFLDTYTLERERGITIFSKQAMIYGKNLEITLLDTPGHVDFSAEMERTLQVLDYAILVISGTDGVQGHTRTLWHLLKRYQIPSFLFINKMDQPGTDREAILRELREKLSDGCVDFGPEDFSELYESAALCEEALLEQFLETGVIEREELVRLVGDRKLFPCYFGSALKLIGVEQLLEGLETYTVCPDYGTEFGAKVFKILRDGQGNRLTYLKITGGSLRVKDILSNEAVSGDTFLPAEQNTEIWKEKVNQIRIYSGEKFDTADEVQAGGICAVTGLSKTFPGQGLGCENSSGNPVLEPVLTYQIILPPDCEPAVILPKLRILEEEEPQLHLVWNEELQEIQAQVMGEIQIEVLQSLIQERFGIPVTFGTGNIVYKETIADRVEGVGHFEPLRHYAEVHLILEPGEPGSGMQYVLGCSEEVLDKNWQRLILTHLEEKEHKGVLTGSSLTDMKITVASGRAHLKHTEGGDFRQATYRAIRQGLMQAKSILLEPYYSFRLEVPVATVGRAMTDLDQRKAEFAPPETEGEMAVLTGSVPVVTMRDYQREVIAYTKGEGRLNCVLKGYAPCHNATEVMKQSGYDPDRDSQNPSSSVFCSHGSGFYVEWQKVPEYMHLESVLTENDLVSNELEGAGRGQVSDWKEYGWQPEQKPSSNEVWLGVEEVDAIIDRTYHANRKETFVPHKGISHKRRKSRLEPMTREYGTATKKTADFKEKYLLVDGYNVIFAWEELNELAKKNIDGARGKLLDLLCDYQGMKNCNLIVVFDAYRVKGHPTEILDYHNIHVVYTKEAETADQFIEKFAHENGRKYDVTVATSDGLEQIIIRGQGCHLLSARELEKEVKYMQQKVRTEYLEQQNDQNSQLLDVLSEEARNEIKHVTERINNAGNEKG